MRFPIASTVAATFIAGTYVGLQAASHQCVPADVSMLEDVVEVPTFAERQSDTFFVESAQWDAASRSLVINARTFNEKGTLLTITGLPETTWVDAFRITSNYSADFEVAIPEGNPVPCQVSIRTAVEQRIISIDNAPETCAGIDATFGRRNANSKTWERELFGRNVDRRLLADAGNSGGHY